MKKILKKQAADFYDAVRGRMAKFPVHPKSWPDHSAWLVQTCFGPLSVSVYPHQYSYYSIFMRFETEEATAKAFKVIGDAMNGYSGKWNILTASPNMALFELDNRLERVKAAEA